MTTVLKIEIYNTMNPSKEKIANNLKNVLCDNFPFWSPSLRLLSGRKSGASRSAHLPAFRLVPPLISFNVDHDAQIHNLITRATHFAVHIPQPEQSRLCDHFAISSQSVEEQFGAVNHYRNRYGSPVLESISTVIQCRAYDKLEAGDHTIIVGEVVEVEQQNEKASVLYYDRSYRSVGKTVPDKKRKVKRAG